MANPTVHFDGDKRIIYEVPDDSSFVVDGNGFRVYTPNNLTGREDEFVQLDFQIDIWSKFQDWHDVHDYSTIALNRSGGGSTGQKNGLATFATNNYEVRTSIGWKIVLANYPHTLEIFGNVISDEGQVSIFDATRLTSQGVLGYVSKADSLQVIFVPSGATPEQSRQMLIEALQATTC